MNIKEVKSLVQGDLVHWTNPLTKTVRTIIVHDVFIGTSLPLADDIVVCVTGKDGSYQECYASELSRGNHA